MAPIDVSNWVSDKNRNMMYEVLATPVLIESALTASIDIELDNHSKIIFCGIGTSGLTGQFMKHYFEYILEDVTVNVYRSSNLPHIKDALYIIYSFSGTTLETLKALKNVHQKGIKPLVFSKGGYLEQYAVKYALPFQKIKIPELPNVKKLETRSHLPFAITFFSRVFSEILNLSKNVLDELKEALNTIKREMEDLERKKEFYMDVSEKIAVSKSVIVLSDYTTEPVARRFRNQLCENAKKISSWDYFPEMGHNLLCALKEEIDRVTLVVFKRASANEIIKKYYEIIDEALSAGSIISILTKDEKFSWKTLIEPVFIGDLISVLVGDKLYRETKPIKQVDIVKTKLKEVVSTG